MGEDEKAGNARRPASLARDEGDLPGAHIGIGLGHLLDDPGLQDGISKVGDAAGLLLARAVGHIGMAELRGDRAVAAWRREEIILRDAILQPIGGEVAHGDVLRATVGGKSRPKRRASSKRSSRPLASFATR